MKQNRQRQTYLHGLIAVMLFTLIALSLSNCFDSSTEEAPASLNTPPPTQSPLPVALDDTLSVPNNTSGVVSVLDNDTSTIDVLTIDSHDVTGTNGGSIVYNGDGTYTYTPPGGFEGEDSFTYTVIDADGNKATATVVVTVSSQVIPNGMAYYIQNCKVCHAAGNEDTTTAFMASDLALRANPLSRDTTAYGGEFQLMGSFYDIPQQKVDELKAFLANITP